jgi:AcrR family transcriptional regulator
MTMARSGLQERRRADNVNDILEAARELVGSDGPGALTLSAVASRVGLTTPALYHYFESKRALLQDLIAAETGAEAEMLVETALRWRGDEAELVGEIVRAMYHHYRPNLSAFRLIYMHLQIGAPSSTGMDRALLARLHPHSKAMFDALEAVLERGKAAGRVAVDTHTRRAVVAAHAAAVGLLTMIGLAERADDPLRHTDDVLLRALSDLLVSGVRPR